MAVPRAGGRAKVSAEGAQAITFGKGSLDMASGHVSERIKVPSAAFPGKRESRGSSSFGSGSGGGDFGGLPEDLDLSGLDLDDDSDAQATLPPSLGRPSAGRRWADPGSFEIRTGEFVRERPLEPSPGEFIGESLALGAEGPEGSPTGPGAKGNRPAPGNGNSRGNGDSGGNGDGGRSGKNAGDGGGDGDGEDFEDDEVKGDTAENRVNREARGPEDGGSGRGKGPSGGKPFRPSKPAIWGVVIAALAIVIIWGGISSLSPPEEETPTPAVQSEAAAPTVEAPAPPPVEISPGSLEAEGEWRDNLIRDVYEVQSGGTLSAALEKLSLSQEQRRAFYQVLETKEMLTKVMPGEEFSAWWASSERKPDDLERLEYRPVGASRPLIFLPGGPDGFYLVELGSPPRPIHQAAQGTVSATFWEAADKAGLEPNLIMRIVDLLASQIDFVSDIRTGDSFQIMFLGEYQDGHLASKPIIEMIRFTNKDQRYEFYRHVSKEGEDGYYDAQFRSIKKTFFKSPLQYSRISSGFTKARLHPILKIVRPHLGVDYAAPTGTPVSAVADGVVDYAGFRGGYGRLVVLAHEGDIITMYGHLSAIAKGITKGTKVSQGDLIGNVGASGLATGPHLDFRIRRKGQFVDPETVLSEQQGQPMPQDDRMEFSQKVARDQELLTQLLEVN